MATETTVMLAAGNLRLELSPSIGGLFPASNGSTATRRDADIAQMPQSARKCPRRGQFPARALRQPHPRRPFHLPRARGEARAEHGRRPEPAARPGLAEPVAGRGAARRTAILSFRHEAGEWPWDYEARQHFALDERGLSLRLTCRNTCGEPMPCGLGQHPYFPADRRRGSTRR